jgi:hypothetical protein
MENFWMHAEKNWRIGGFLEMFERDELPPADIRPTRPDNPILSILI